MFIYINLTGLSFYKENNHNINQYIRFSYYDSHYYYDNAVVENNLLYINQVNENNIIIYKSSYSFNILKLKYYV
jgi:hypothetical protein